MTETSALGELIKSAARSNRGRANGGRSMQEAADRATSLGHPISKSSISEATKGAETITPKLIYGIAAGYDIPAAEVARAMLTDLGVPIPDYSPTVEAAIRRDPDLSTEARAMLLAAIDAARNPLSRSVPVMNQVEDLGSRWGGGFEPAPPAKDSRVRRNK